MVDREGRNSNKVLGIKIRVFKVFYGFIFEFFDSSFLIVDLGFGREGFGLSIRRLSLSLLCGLLVLGVFFGF